MKIAVIGAGISGNLVARLLAARHEVDVFESADYPGGHTRSLDVEAFGSRFTVDTGFMVFNERTYPNFCRMLQLLGVSWQDSDMSFSVSCRRTGLEYQGSGLNGLFAQRSNLLNPGFYRMLRDILSFNARCGEVLEDPALDVTMGEYLERRRYGQSFINQYLVPMSAAIWSCEPSKLLDFPARFLVAFFQNHGLVQLRDRPQWKTVSGSARTYVAALLEPLADRIRLNCPVRAVKRHADYATVYFRESAENYDHVVFATHADETLQILDDDVDASEKNILTAFPYQQNEAILHTDRNWLPKSRRAWASWNYHVPQDRDLPVSVTYDLSRLQRVDSPHPILLTLNPCGPVREDQVLRRMSFDHPSYRMHSPAAQARQDEIQGKRRTWFCGAYWGYGFHEDGVNSALRVANAFELDLDACTAAYTKAKSGTDAVAP